MSLVLNKQQMSMAQVNALMSASDGPPRLRRGVPTRIPAIRRWGVRYEAEQYNRAQADCDDAAMEIQCIVGRARLKDPSHPYNAETGFLSFVRETNRQKEAGEYPRIVRQTIPSDDIPVGAVYRTTEANFARVTRYGCAEEATAADLDRWALAEYTLIENAKESARRRRRLIRHLNQIRRLHRRKYGPGPAPERLPARIERTSPPAPQQDGGGAYPKWLGPAPELSGFFDSQDLLLSFNQHLAQQWLAFWTAFVSVLPLGVDRPRFLPWMMTNDPNVDVSVHFGLAMLDRSRCPTSREMRFESIPHHRNWFVCVMPTAEGTLYMLQRWGTSWPVTFPRDKVHLCPGQDPEGRPVEPWYPPPIFQEVPEPCPSN